MKKKLWTKAMSAAVCVAMVGTMLVGCGQGNDPGEEGGSESGAKTLDVWLPPLSANQDDKEVWDKVDGGS